MHDMILSKDTENGEDGDQGEDEESTGDELFGTGDEGGDEGGDEDTSDTGGDESEGDEGGSIDDEMMGDVQPESTETTQS